MLDRLKEKCNEMILLDDIDKEKYLIIKKILEKENAFLEINIEYAYSILRDLGIPEDMLMVTYMELIDSNNINFDS